MITPVDLETTVFRRGFRGYNRAEVQEFMARITHDYEHLYRENIELKERIEELQNSLNQYQIMEETLRNAMLLAQETAEEVKNAAKNQAELIIRDAEYKGERIKSHIQEEIQNEVQKLAALKNQVEFFRCQFKSFLKGLLDIAENQMELKIDWTNKQLNNILFEGENKAQKEEHKPVAETAVTGESRPESQSKTG